MEKCPHCKAELTYHKIDYVMLDVPRFRKSLKVDLKSNGLTKIYTSYECGYTELYFQCWHKNNPYPKPKFMKVIQDCTLQ